MFDSLTSFLMLHLKKHRWYLLGAVICTVATNSLAALIPRLVKQILDHPELSPQRWLGWMLLAGFVTFFVRPLSRYWFFVPGRIMEFETRNDFFRHLLTLHPKDISKFSIGDLIARANQDIQSLRFLTGFVLLSTVHVSSALVANFFFMATLSWPLTTGIALILGVSLLFAYRGSYQLMQLSRDYFQKSGALVDTLTQVLYSAPLLRNYDATDEAVKFLKTEQELTMAPQFKMIHIRAWIMPLVALASSLSVGLLLLFSGFTPEGISLTVGDMAAFLGHASLLVSPLMHITWMVSMTQTALTGIERIQEIQRQPESIALSPTPSSIKVQSLEVRGLSIEEPKTQRKLLSNIQLQWDQGRTWGFFGPTGSGKSVLFRAISGIDTLPGAPILLNRRTATRLELLQATSLVGQSPFLFSVSLAENVRVGRSGFSDGDVLRALQHAGFQLDTIRFPQGLETRVGQKGVTLSGGQRQRVALARALLGGKSLLLLDDVLSAVDHETESVIIENLYRYYRNPGFWIASHRISALRHADHIFCLEHGVMVASGTHQDLLRTYAPYRRVYELQYQQGARRDGSA